MAIQPHPRIKYLQPSCPHLCLLPRIHFNFEVLDSYSKMAEAVGFASAGAGIASFAVQVFDSISALNATYQYNRKKSTT